ncbi:MAG: S-adenosylmethionine:tRNA ribosyltransferase-isomerase [Bacteroidaceae bacterium]|nr:S-adenosylmethionine:tRNA ribosyltransferase-isomerase [Bacteroidaceae bacterium]
MEPKHIHIKDYNYHLPDDRIAKYPLPRRDCSKLLVYSHGQIQQDIFRNIPGYLPKGALMVFNNTKVIRARLHFRKESTTQSGNQPGALIEIFLLEPAMPAEYQENFSTHGKCQWYCLVGNSKKWKHGKLNLTIDTGGHQTTLSAERTGSKGTSHIIEFTWDSQYTWSEIIEKTGELPIPPYLNRKTEKSDLSTYQTVYSKIDGSVAAPTAGLHFTPEVLQALGERGIECEEVTLHVGAGTFKPVKTEEIGDHDMHSEHIAVHRDSIEKLARHGAKAIAVGTTSVRTLESLYYMGITAKTLTDTGKATGDAGELHVAQWMPYCDTTPAMPPADALRALLSYMDCHNLDILQSSTQIIIAPGYDYKIVQMMVTNFHQPQSTLLLLVSAFINQPGRDFHGDWHTIYDYALSHDFRFLSYGDSSLLIP